MQCPQACSRPLLTHASPGDSWTLTGKSGSVSYGVTAPFSWVLVHTRFYLCPQVSISQSYVSSGGSVGGLMVTSSKRAYATPRSLAPRAPAPAAVHCWPGPPQETLKHSSQSLWGLWVLVCTRFVWALWASLADMGFHSKCDFTPPSVFRGKQPQVKKMFNQPLVCIFYPPQVMQSGSVFEGGQYFSSLEKQLDLLGNQWFSSSTGLSITQESHGMCVFLASRFCLPEGTDTLVRVVCFTRVRAKTLLSHSALCEIIGNAYSCHPIKSSQDPVGMTIYWEGQCSITSTLVKSKDMESDCLGSLLSSVATWVVLASYFSTLYLYFLTVFTSKGWEN